MTRARRSDEVQIGRALRLDRRSALELLKDLGRDRAVLSDLRRLWAKESASTSLCFASDEQVLGHLADLVAAGSLVIARVRSPPPMAPPPGAGDVAGEAPPPAEGEDEKVEDEKSWIELTVLDIATGAPMGGVPLLITPASGSEAEHKTDDKGVVRLDDITKGSCLVRCKLGDVTRADALVFMGTSAGGPPAGDAKPKKKAGKKGGPPCIVSVEKHKVRTGETLDSVARSVGSTWQKVAKFNWGTDSPKKIDRFLGAEVGCTKKTSDGKSFVFDDSDEPGIILLPREWKAEGTDTGRAYTIEVVSATAARRWVFSQ